MATSGEGPAAWMELDDEALRAVARNSGGEETEGHGESGGGGDPVGGCDDDDDECGVEDDNKTDFEKIVAENWIGPPKRERKWNCSDAGYFKQALCPEAPTKQMEPQIPCMPLLHDFQFFNIKRLTELYAKEARYHMHKNQLKDTICEGDKLDDIGEPLTAKEQQEKELLMEEGFLSWTRKDFSTFIQACEKYGMDDIRSIAYEMEGKAEEEVERYANVFKQRYQELPDYDQIVKSIERGGAKMSRKEEIMKAIGRKMDCYENPWFELKIQYDQNRGNLYSEQCDRFMLCMMHKFGYGNWDEIKAAIRMSPLFRFEWFVKSRTSEQLARRCDMLICLLEKEHQEHEEQERQARKENEPPKNMMPFRQSQSPICEMKAMNHGRVWRA